jgi:hypothetical protein
MLVNIDEDKFIGASKTHIMYALGFTLGVFIFEV